MPEMFAIGGPNTAFELALKVAEALEAGDHNLAVDLCFAVRDAITAFSIAMALVTSIQDPEKPVICFSPEEAQSGEAEEHTPGEMLQFLAECFPGGDTWEGISESFKQVVTARKAESEISKMPEEVFVSDILLAKKKEGD